MMNLKSNLIARKMSLLIGILLLAASAQAQIVIQPRPISAGGAVSNPILACDGTAALPCYAFNSAPSYGFWFASNTVRLSTAGVETLRLSTDVWAESNSSLFRLGSSGDVNLAWDAANQLGLRNSTNAQKLNIYRTYTNATTYERLSIYMDTTTSQGIIETNSNGGVARALILGTVGNAAVSIQVNNANRWLFGSSGDTYAFQPAVDATYSIGTATNRVLNYLGSGTVTATGGFITGSAGLSFTAFGDITPTATGKFKFRNSAGTTGVLIDVSVDQVFKLRSTDDSNYADLSAKAGFFSTYTQTGTTTVSGLPTCNAGNKALRYYVSDATQALTAGIGAIVAGSGANNVPVNCDGSNWRIG